MLTKRWQDWVTLIAGAWMAVSPWALGNADMATAPFYNPLIVGLAVVVVSALELSREQMWEAFINLLLGLWAVVSPWVLAYATVRGALINTVLVGALVAVMSVWVLVERFDIMHRWHKGHTT